MPVKRIARERGETVRNSSPAFVSPSALEASQSRRSKFGAAREKPVKTWKP